MKKHKTHIPAGNLKSQHIKSTHEEEAVEASFHPFSITC